VCSSRAGGGLRQSACDAHRQLVIQLLGEMARKSRYPSRHSYIAYHLPHLAARWIEAGLPIVNRNTLDTASLFELQELMAPSEAALHNLRVRATETDLRSAAAAYCVCRWYADGIVAFA
jgi:hypothetical protein